MTKPKTPAKPGKSTSKPASGTASPTTQKGSKSPRAGTKRAETATSPPRSAKKPTPTTTVTELADLYLSHLDEIGKSPSTLFSYGQDLRTARAHFGDGARISDLTVDQIETYFESDTVCMRKTGKPKTEVTIKKTRRVLRMALVWAAEKGMIEKAPIPSGQ